MCSFSVKRMTMTEPSFLGTILCSERFSPATFENLLNHETYVVQQCIDLLGKEFFGGGLGWVVVNVVLVSVYSRTEIMIFLIDFN